MRSAVFLLIGLALGCGSEPALPVVHSPPPPRTVAAPIVAELLSEPTPVPSTSASAEPEPVPVPRGEEAVARWRKLLLDHLGESAPDPQGDYRGDFDGDGAPDAALFSAGYLFVSTDLETAEPSWQALLVGAELAPVLESADWLRQEQPELGQRIAGERVFVFGGPPLLCVYFDRERDSYLWIQVVRGLDAALADARRRFPAAFGLSDNHLLDRFVEMSPFAAWFAGDFDGDGKIDLLVVADKALHFYRAGGTRPERTPLDYDNPFGGMRGLPVRDPGRSFTPIVAPGEPEIPVVIRHDSIALWIPGVSSVEVFRDKKSWRTAFTSD